MTNLLVGILAGLLFGFGICQPPNRMLQIKIYDEEPEKPEKEVKVS